MYEKGLQDVAVMNDGELLGLHLAILQRQGELRASNTTVWRVLIVCRDQDNESVATISDSGFASSRKSVAQAWARSFNNHEDRDVIGAWAVLERCTKNAPKNHENLPNR